MISYHYLNEFSKGKLETEISNRVSKAKTRLHLFCLTSLCDWSGNSRHSLNQSDAKPKQITTWSPAFSRALGSLVVFTPSSHWLLMFFPFFWFVFVIALDTQSKSTLYVVQMIVKNKLGYSKINGHLQKCRNAMFSSLILLPENKHYPEFRIWIIYLM